MAGHPTTYIYINIDVFQDARTDYDVNTYGEETVPAPQGLTPRECHVFQLSLCLTLTRTLTSMVVW